MHRTGPLEWAPKIAHTEQFTGSAPAINLVTNNVIPNPIGTLHS